MEITFKKHKEEEAINNPGDEGRVALQKILTKKAPSCTEKEIYKTLNALRAAQNLNEPVLKRKYNLHHLEGNHKGEFAVDVLARKERGRGRYRIIFRPTFPEQFQDGNLSTVTDIIITTLIENYH